MNDYVHGYSKNENSRLFDQANTLKELLHHDTVYPAGDSVLEAGCGVVVGSKKLTEPIRDYLKISGGVIDPNSSYLLIRGMKTFELRMQCLNANGQAVAEHLEKHPDVSRVYYPGLPSHPHHEVAKQQMKGFGAVVTFEIADDTAYVLDFLSRLEILNIGPSLGGVESLITHPATVSYYAYTKAERRELGITDGLIRLSVGVENVEDIIDDIDQALEKAGAGFRK